MIIFLWFIFKIKVFQEILLKEKQTLIDILNFIKDIEYLPLLGPNQIRLCEWQRVVLLGKKQWGEGTIFWVLQNKESGNRGGWYFEQEKKNYKE